MGFKAMVATKKPIQDQEDGSRSKSFEAFAQRPGGKKSGRKSQRMGGRGGKRC